MDQKEKDAALGGLVRQRAETEERLAALRREAKEMSKLYSGLAHLVLPENIWNISLESYEPHLSKDGYEKLSTLKSGLQQAEKEQADLSKRASKLGP